MNFIGNMGQLIRYLQLPRDRRRIVFYSEGKACWVHLEQLISDLLHASDIPICYVTSNDDDPGLHLEHSNYTAFITDEKWIRNWLFENIDADVLVTTTPDLGHYQIKRSRHPVHYIYAQHSMVSLHMAYRKGAFDSFDTILCSGRHHINEIKAMEAKYHLPQKCLIKHSYSRLFKIMEESNKHIRNIPNKDRITHVLIAPSWGAHGLIETVGLEIVNLLLKDNFKVTLRPHPQTVKFSAATVDIIQRRFVSNQRFALEIDMAGQESLHESDIMISDWSGAALEYAFGLNKPVLFLDVERKTNNTDYEELEIIPFEVSVRERIGRILSIHALSSITSIINDMLRSPTAAIEREAARNDLLFDNGVNSEAVSHIIGVAQRRSAG